MRWRGGREAEGAPLLREYGSKAHRGFKSHPLRQNLYCYLLVRSQAREKQSPFTQGSSKAIVE